MLRFSITIPTSMCSCEDIEAYSPHLVVVSYFLEMLILSSRHIAKSWGFVREGEEGAGGDASQMLMVGYVWLDTGMFDDY